MRTNHIIIESSRVNLSTCTSSNMDCFESYCSDCQPEWIKCQFCDKKVCHMECAYDCMHVCSGDVCKRVNCKYGDCINDNLDEVECVDTCESELEHEWGCGEEFCNDCRVKKIQVKGWMKCCSVCVRTVAPILANVAEEADELWEENERLRAKVKKLRKENQSLRDIKA